ncbi:hypothetical protein D4764_20G0001040, partial [Takifugu flavidus]
EDCSAPMFPMKNQYSNRGSAAANGAKLLELARGDHVLLPPIYTCRSTPSPGGIPSRVKNVEDVPGEQMVQRESWTASMQRQDCSLPCRGL